MLPVAENDDNVVIPSTPEPEPEPEPEQESKLPTKARDSEAKRHHEEEDSSMTERNPSKQPRKDKPCVSHSSDATEELKWKVGDRVIFIASCIGGTITYAEPERNLYDFEPDAAVTREKKVERAHYGEFKERLTDKQIEDMVKAMAAEDGHIMTVRSAWKHMMTQLLEEAVPVELIQWMFTKQFYQYHHQALDFMNQLNDVLYAEQPPEHTKQQSDADRSKTRRSEQPASPPSDEDAPELSQSALVRGDDIPLTQADRE